MRCTRCGPRSKKAWSPAAGVALARAVKDVEALKLPPERKAGADIVARAMSEPLRQIARNAGEEAAVVYNRVIEGKGDFGFNAASGQFEDLVKAAISIRPRSCARRWRTRSARPR